MAAHSNTANVWFQVHNTFLEAAHLMAQARAYNDIETGEADQYKRLTIHLIKLQFFNSAVHLICKVEDWFLLTAFCKFGMLSDSRTRCSRTRLDEGNHAWGNRQGAAIEEVGADMWQIP